MVEELGFGTSGIRGKVEVMTDKECYINTRGFIDYLFEVGDITQGEVILVSGDLRSSTDRIMLAVAKAVDDSGCKVEYCGKIPSPAVMYYGLLRRCASIMVTGSHIPADRNGIKFNKKKGEVLKADEQGILSNIAKIRNGENIVTGENSLFDEKGAFQHIPSLPPLNDEARDSYIRRYLDVFPLNCLEGLKIVLYQQSSVGRDIIKEVFEALGATVIAPGEEINVPYVHEGTGQMLKEKVRLRSDDFVPVDTEKVTNLTKAVLRRLAEQYCPDVLISADGDSDRPLLADENGKFLPGDKLGALVSLYLKPDFVAIPVSSNNRIVDLLRDKGVKVKLTKIGSPYVIKAMSDELSKNPVKKVAGWEVNGGFLTGSDWIINDKTLDALPTRDALLPLIVAITLAKERDKPISDLINAYLPSWETSAGVIDDNTPGCESYTAEMGKKIVEIFSPKDSRIREVHFTIKGIDAFDENGEKHISAGVIREELTTVKQKFIQYFTKSRGFGDISAINYIDGIKVSFANNEVSHLRPSGNAPEFRYYSQAATIERAEEIAEKRFEILPEIIEDVKRQS